MDREQVAKKREEIKERIRISRNNTRLSTNDKVEATTLISTNIKALVISIGMKGIISSVYKWVDGYDVEFKVHGYSVVIACLSNQIKKAN